MTTHPTKPFIPTRRSPQRFSLKNLPWHLPWHSLKKPFNPKTVQPPAPGQPCHISFSNGSDITPSGPYDLYGGTCFLRFMKAETRRKSCQWQLWAPGSATQDDAEVICSLGFSSQTRDVLRLWLSIFWDTFVGWHLGLNWAATDDTMGIFPVLSIAEGGSSALGWNESTWELWVFKPG